MRRRYREFLGLHRSLRRQLARVPAFPGKYLLTKKTSHIIEQRRADLQSYMKVSGVKVRVRSGAVRVSGVPCVASCRVLLTQACLASPWPTRNIR